MIGNAETLYKNFKPNYVDCMFCIESSRLYGNIDNFFKSAHIVLKTPSEESKEDSTGLLLYADYFTTEEWAKVKENFLKYFDIVKQVNISANVWYALEIDAGKRKQRIFKSLNCLIRKIAIRCSSMFDDTLYTNLKNKTKQYYAFVLKKKILDEEIVVDSD